MASVPTISDELTDEQIEAARAELIETDGEPLETPWHRAEINLLIESIWWHFRNRTDFFVGGNCFIYYSLTQARERKYKGPDFFYVNNVDGTRKRLYWWVFEEDGRFPDVIIELSSPSTIHADLTTKKDLYERQFKTPEYFCYDPSTEALRGWRLSKGVYKTLRPNERGWLWSEELQLWLGKWQGDYLGADECWLRFFERSGQLAPTKADDLAAELGRLKANHAGKKKKKHNGQS